jgi:hypothetical protein
VTGDHSFDDGPVTIDQLRNVYQAQPFRPFVLHLADGRQLPVEHREFISFSSTGRTVIVHQRNESHDVIDLLLVTDLEVKPPANGSRKRPRNP